MERYKFLQDWTDPLNPIKTILAGSVVRSFGPSQMAALIADGIVMQVGDYTRCVKNPLETAGACSVLSDEQAAMYSDIAFGIALSEKSNEGTITNKQTKK